MDDTNKRKPKAMISQPMWSALPEKEIIAVKDRATKILEDLGYEVVGTYFHDEWIHRNEMRKNGVVSVEIAFLSKYLEKMAECDAVYFCKGWESQRICNIEHSVAGMFGLKLLYD